MEAFLSIMHVNMILCGISGIIIDIDECYHYYLEISRVSLLFCISAYFVRFVADRTVILASYCQCHLSVCHYFVCPSVCDAEYCG